MVTPTAALEPVLIALERMKGEGLPAEVAEQALVVYDQFYTMMLNNGRAGIIALGMFNATVDDIIAQNARRLQ